MVQEGSMDPLVSRWMWESTRGLINMRNRWTRSQACLHYETTQLTQQSRLSSGQMGSNQSKTSGPIMPDLKFRVLVLGRANAGKTTILQRVCETTESPKIYRRGKEVRHGGSNFYPEV
jgi:hypothetical protein